MTELEIELKRVSALKSLVSSLEEQLAYYRKKDYNVSESRLKALEESLESEKRMNEILTTENEELELALNHARELHIDIDD